MLLKPTDLRHGLAVALFALLGPVALAQDDSEADAPPAEEEATAEVDAPDELDDPELDVQGFDPTADDDFIPSEDIPADAPIAFPTDI